MFHAFCTNIPPVEPVFFLLSHALPVCTVHQSLITPGTFYVICTVLTYICMYIEKNMGKMEEVDL